MKSGLRRLLEIAALLMLGAPPVFADLTTGAKTPLPQAFRHDVAYSRFNHVYLTTWDKPPVSGQFADANGALIGGRFQIATEAVGENPYTSWSTVTAGGTAADPVFLVTYLANEGAATRKYARVIRFVNGGAVIGTRTLVADVTGQWFSANSARAAWDGDRFVVSTQVKPAGWLNPTPQVQQVDLAGNVSAPVILGDNADYEAAPSLACAPDHTCMLAGFAQGVPFGAKGGIYARLFNGQSLQPIGGVFYLDDHSTFMDSPQVVWNPRINKFSTLWFRRTGAMVDFRLVGSDGQMGALDLTKSFGTGAGDLAYAFNEGTGTGLLVTKAGANADLYALEVGDSGYYAGVNTLITPYDNLGWPTYSSAVAANPENGTWLSSYMLAKNGWLAGVTGKLAPVGPVSNPVVLLNGPVAGAVRQPFDVIGWAADFGSPSDSGADAVHVWAWPTGGDPIFLGAVTPSLSRPDVGAIFGERFTNSGYKVTVSGLAPGRYVLAIYMHSTVTGTFNAQRTVEVVVQQGVNGPTGGNDADGDTRTDLTVYNLNSGAWATLLSSGGAANTNWGGQGYTPVRGDFDGDGTADVGVYHAATGNWYVLLSSTGFTKSLSRNVGGPFWQPVSGDFDGDGKTDLVVYHVTTGVWYGLKSESGFATSFTLTFGGTGSTAIPGDFDGDGRADIAVYDRVGGKWSVLFSRTSYTTGAGIFVGGTGWDPVAADFDGDGKTDPVVYNSTTGVWYGLKSSTGYTTTVNVRWGGTGFSPVRGDYDGDGRADLAVYEQATGVWSILLSGAGYTTAISRNLGGINWVPAFLYFF